MTSYVYFVRGDETGAIKIGTTKHLATRMSGIATSSSESITFLGAVEGDLVFEKALHKEFAADRIRREWFRPTDALISRIARLLDGQEVIPHTDSKRVAADDDYTKLAIKRLITIENNSSTRMDCDGPTARIELAKRLGLSVKTLSNYRYGRTTGPISARDYFAIEDAYIAEMETQLDELKSDLSILEPRAAAEATYQAALAARSLSDAKSKNKARETGVCELLKT